MRAPVLSVVALVWMAGCAANTGPARVALEAADPQDRIRAIVEVTEHASPEEAGDTTAALVDRLDDEDVAVRFFAIRALDHITGRRFGYRAFDPVGVRRVSVDRWRAYLAARQDELPVEDP